MSVYKAKIQLKEKKDGMINVNRLVQFAFLFGAVILLVVTIGWRMRLHFQQYTGFISEIDTGWFYYEDSEQVYVTLPADIRLSGTRHLALYNNNIGAYRNGDVISTKAAVYKPDIIRNGNLLYSYDDSRFERNEQMASDIYCNAVINNVNGSGAVTIVYHSSDDSLMPGGSYLFHIPAIYVGDPDMMLLFNCSENLVSLLFIGMFFAASAGAFAAWLMFRRLERSARFLDIAAFLLLAGIWRLTDSGLILSAVDQYRGSILSIVSFYAFMAIGAAMTMLAKHTVDTDSTYFDTVFTLFLLNIIVQALVNMIFGIQYIDMLVVTQAMLPAGAVLLLLKTYDAYVKTRDNSCYKLILGLMFLLVSGLVSLEFYWVTSIHYEIIIEAGMFTFAFFMLYDASLQTVDQYIAWKKRTMDTSRHIDEVTGMYDRYTFEHDIGWLRYHDGDEAEHKEGRGIFGMLAAMERSHADTHSIETKKIGYTCINIEIDGKPEPDGEESIHELFRLAAAGRAVKNSFTGDGSCYCIDTRTIRVLMPEGEKHAKAFIDRLTSMTSAYNRYAHEDDKVKLILNVAVI